MHSSSWTLTKQTFDSHLHGVKARCLNCKIISWQYNSAFGCLDRRLHRKLLQSMFTWQQCTENGQDFPLLVHFLVYGSVKTAKYELHGWRSHFVKKRRTQTDWTWNMLFVTVFTNLRIVVYMDTISFSETFSICKRLYFQTTKTPLSCKERPKRMKCFLFLIENGVV